METVSSIKSFSSFDFSFWLVLLQTTVLLLLLVLQKWPLLKEKSRLTAFFLFLFLFYLPCVWMKKACTAKNGHCPVEVLSIHVTPPYNHLRLFFSCYLRHLLPFHFFGFCFTYWPSHLIIFIAANHHISRANFNWINSLCHFFCSLSLFLSLAANWFLTPSQSVSQLVSVLIFTLASSLFN